MVNKVTPDTMLSASRLPSVMGLSRYNTPNDELEYSIRALQGKEREDIGNESMDWGNQMEPLILKEAAKRLLLKDLEIEHTEALYSDEYPLACSLDGSAVGTGEMWVTDPEQGIYVVGQDVITLDGVGVLEAKLTAMDAEDSPPLWRGPIQLQAQMDIMKAKWGAICTLYRGTQLRIFLFAPHQATVERIAEIARDFQSRLENWKETGEITYYSPADGEKWGSYRGNYPVTDEAVTLSPEAERLAEMIISASNVVKEAEATKQRAEEQLKALMGEHTKGEAGRFVIGWPTRSYKAQPEKVVPAKDAYTIRQSTLTIKEARA